MCAAAAGAGDAPTLEGLLRDVDGDDPEAREVALRARDGYNPKDLVVQRLLQLRPFKNNPREAADLLSLLARVVAVAANRRPAKQRSNSRILACCYRAYTLDPKNERARVQLGWELYHRKEYSRVLALAREAPDSVKAVAALAEEKLKSWKREHSNTPDDITFDSPLKDSLIGVGEKKAKPFSPTGDDGGVTIREADTSAKTAKRDVVDDAKRALWPELSVPTRLSEALQADLDGLLEPADGGYRAVAYNARASLPTHGLTPGIVATKASNLTRAVRLPPPASVVVSVECPGSFVQIRGGPEAKKTLDPGSTFGEMLVAPGNLDGFDQRTLPCAGTNAKNGDCGESHVVAWDQEKWALDDGVDPRSLVCARLHRAVGFTVLQSREKVDVRLALLSCHLKSGGRERTKEDVKALMDEVIPAAWTLLDEKPRAGDSLLVLGDFNLAPTDDAFRRLGDELGFRNVGGADGNPRNMAEFLKSGEPEVYDSAWLWQRTWRVADRAKDPNSGEVLEIPDVSIAAEDRNKLMVQLTDACGSWQPKSELGQAAKATLEADGLRYSISRAVIDAFKEQVQRDWSDHKPICLHLWLW